MRLHHSVLVRPQWNSTYLHKSTHAALSDPGDRRHLTKSYRNDCFYSPTGVLDLVITNNSVHSTLSLASLPRQVQCLVEHWLAIPAHGAKGWSRHVLFSIFSSTGSNGYQHPGPKVDHTQNSKETPPQLWNCSARWDKILKKTNSARTFKRQRCAHRTASHCALCSQLSINR